MVKRTISQQVFDSSADFGVFITLMGLASSIFFGIVMVIIGIYLIATKGTHSASTEGRVVGSKCNYFRDKKGQVTKLCDTKYTYSVNKKPYRDTKTTSIQYANDMRLDILYEPSNPANSVIRTGWRKRGAYVMIIIAFVMVLFAAARYYIVKEYKFAASATGIGEGLSIMSSPFRSSSSAPVDMSTDMLTPIENP